MFDCVSIRAVSKQFDFPWSALRHMCCIKTVRHFIAVCFWFFPSQLCGRKVFLLSWDDVFNCLTLFSLCDLLWILIIYFFFRCCLKSHHKQCQNPIATCAFAAFLMQVIMFSNLFNAFSSHVLPKPTLHFPPFFSF